MKMRRLMFRIGTFEFLNSEHADNGGNGSDEKRDECGIHESTFSNRPNL